MCDGAGIQAVLRKPQNAVQFDLALRDAEIFYPCSWNWCVGLSSLVRRMLDNHNLFLSLLLGRSKMFCRRIETAFVHRVTGISLSLKWFTLVSCAMGMALSSSLGKPLPVPVPQITQNIGVAFTRSRMNKFFNLIITLVICLILELLDLF